MVMVSAGRAELFCVDVVNETVFRGERQLVHHLGPTLARKLVDDHRQSFVTATDVQALAAAGVMMMVVEMFD